MSDAVLVSIVWTAFILLAGGAVIGFMYVVAFPKKDKPRRSGMVE